MLNAGIVQNYREKRAEMLRQNNIEVLVSPNGEDGNIGAAALATIPAADFFENNESRDEVFGPYTLVVVFENETEMQKVAAHLQSQLTITILGNENEIINHQKLFNKCREKAGRVIFNGVPTGVRVSPAMQHGGLFPATMDSKFKRINPTKLEIYDLSYTDWLWLTDKKASKPGASTWCSFFGTSWFLGFKLFVEKGDTLAHNRLFYTLNHLKK